ncbi:MFS transporter, partial [Streptomyces sp. TRM76130]|nr:MFS transporter [Streptomyces sp. TRM76130]
AALRGAFPEHTLHTAFAAGLNAAAVTAGAVAAVAGVLVLALARDRRGVSGDTPSPAATRERSGVGR